MKMHHLDEDGVKAVMEKVQTAVEEEELSADKVEEIFKLSKVDPDILARVVATLEKVNLTHTSLTPVQ